MNKLKKWVQKQKNQLSESLDFLILLHKTRIPYFVHQKEKKNNNDVHLTEKERIDQKKGKNKRKIDSESKMRPSTIKTNVFESN